MNEQRQRLFFAIWLPSQVVADLLVAVRPVQAEAPEWIRWQPESRWHLTVLFLGSCSAAQAADAASAGAAVAAETQPAPVRLRGAGGTASVLWLQVVGAEWLLPVHRELRRSLLPRKQRERFRPHVTVARARQHRVRRHHVDVLGAYEGPAWTPRELALVSSITGPHPAYETVERFPFSR